MNYHTMISWHREQWGEVTLATIQVSPEEAGRFGIVEMDCRAPRGGVRGKTGTRPPGPLDLQSVDGQRFRWPST